MKWELLPRKAQKSFPEELVGKIGRVHQARCYMAPPHRINGARYQLMAEFLKKKGCQIGQRIFIPERMAAARAGVATYGKNNFAYTDGIGSFILLSSFLVDTELELIPPPASEENYKFYTKIYKKISSPISD